MLNVLIVDDSLIVRRNMQKILEKINLKVVGDAKNGIEAVNMCASLKPDLITMDITMPDMDGITAVKLIREFDKDVRIIMSTSHGQEKMVLESIKAGARGYMLKPITEEKLLTTLQKAFPHHSFSGEIHDELELIDEASLSEIHNEEVSTIEVQ